MSRAFDISIERGSEVVHLIHHIHLIVTDARPTV